MKRRMTTLLTLTLTLVLSFGTATQSWAKRVKGNGHVTKETRAVSGIAGIKASTGVNVYLFQGNEEKVVVETDENLQECLITKMDGDILKCYVDCSVNHASKLNVYVNYKVLNKIKASSGSDVYGETTIKTDFLDIDVSSGADVKVEVDADELSCDVSSGADAVLKGTVGYFNAEASSGADIKASELKVKECKANASSAGDIRVHVADKIEASASSGGDVVYYGNPTVEHVRESSGGDVKRK